MKYLSISIIISNWCRQHLIPCVIYRIKTQQYPPDKIEFIIVDDHSHNKKEVFQIVKDVIHRYGDEFSIRFFETNQDVTFNCAFRYNVGIRHARNDVVLLNESDGLQTGDYLRIVNTHHKENDRIFLSPNIINVKENKKSPSPRGPLVDLGGSCRREHLARVRGFDETYTGYGGLEDRMRIRLQTIGVHCIKPAELEILHLNWMGATKPDDYARPGVSVDSGRNGDWGKVDTLQEITF